MGWVLHSVGKPLYEFLHIHFKIGWAYLLKKKRVKMSIAGICAKSSIPKIYCQKVLSFVDIKILLKDWYFSAQRLRALNTLWEKKWKEIKNPFFQGSVFLLRQLTKQEAVLELPWDFVLLPLVLKSTFVRGLCIRKVLCVWRAVSTDSIWFLYLFFFLLLSVSSFKYTNPKEPSVCETCPAQQIGKSENRELKPDPCIFDFNI